MAVIKATIVAPYVLDWLKRTTAVRVLHQFEQVGNLVNQLDEVVSIAAPAIGPGPFTVVVPVHTVGNYFQGTLVHTANNLLFVGENQIDISEAEVWQPQPDWESWRRKQAVWKQVIPHIQAVAQSRRQVTAEIETAVFHHLQQIETQLITAVSTQNHVDFQAAVAKMAGLGSGLTPAGDDFLVGALYGLYATRPVADVQPWAKIVVETAVPRTTTLSAAWLKAAARGEAVAAWHEFGQQLIVNNGEWETAVRQILAIGHSSGADALAGFTAVTK